MESSQEQRVAWPVSDPLLCSQSWDWASHRVLLVWLVGSGFDVTSCPWLLSLVLWPCMALWCQAVESRRWSCWRLNETKGLGPSATVLLSQCFSCVNANIHLNYLAFMALDGLIIFYWFHPVLSVCLMTGEQITFTNKKTPKDKLVTGCMHFADSHRQYTAFPKHLSLTVTIQLSAKTINKILNVQTSSASSCSFLFLSLQSSFSCLQDFINFHLISFHFLFSSFTWTKSRSILHCSVFFPFFFSRSVYMPEHLSVQVTFEYWISRLWW